MNQYHTCAKIDLSVKSLETSVRTLIKELRNYNGPGVNSLTIILKRLKPSKFPTAH